MNRMMIPIYLSSIIGGIIGYLILPKMSFITLLGLSVISMLMFLIPIIALARNKFEEIEWWYICLFIGTVMLTASAIFKYYGL